MILKCLIFLQIFLLLCAAVELPPHEIKQIYENGISMFTAKMTHILHYSTSEKDKNVLFSPINIYAILGLTHLTTNGTTADEIATVMGLPNNDEHSVYHYFTNTLLVVQNSTSTELILNEGIFFDKDLQINETFAKKVNHYYRSATENVDYKSPPETTDYINKWVANRTKNRIPTFFTSPVTPDTICMFVSTLYFKSDWAIPFKTSRTSTGKFNTGTEEIDVQFMHDVATVPYTNNPKMQYEAIALDYKNNEYSLFVVLPYTVNGIMSFIHQLTKEDFHRIIKTASDNHTYVDYKIPRMKLLIKNNLKDVLQKIGIKQLFGKADFSKLITSPIEVTVSSVNHVTEIEITEDGTIGSSAVSVQIVKKVLRKPRVSFNVDKPFMFFIYHHNTKTFIFTGVIHHPRE